MERRRERSEWTRVFDFFVWASPWLHSFPLRRTKPSIILLLLLRSPPILKFFSKENFDSSIVCVHTNDMIIPSTSSRKSLQTYPQSEVLKTTKLPTLQRFLLIRSENPFSLTFRRFRRITRCCLHQRSYHFTSR